MPDEYHPNEYMSVPLAGDVRLKMLGSIHHPLANGPLAMIGTSDGEPPICLDPERATALRDALTQWLMDVED